MNRNGQILIVTLWILALLAVLAVSLGHRAALGLRLGQYQIDKMRSLALARAGLNVAVAKIANGHGGPDSLKEPWADSADDFKEIRLGKVLDGYASVSFLLWENGEQKRVYGVMDEDRKININKAPQELLQELLQTAAVSGSDVAGNICAWRGDHGVPVPDYTSEGYANKDAPFSNPEELALVKGVDRLVYDALKDHITVWGSGLVNINTAPQTVLDILIAYCKNRITSGENDTRELSQRIMDVRPVDSFGELTEKLMAQHELSTGETNVLQELAALVDVRSSHFHIFSTGRIVRSNVVSNVECVMNRGKGRVVYWHEN